MLEARDAFSPAIRIMPVCRVGTGRRASAIIEIMPSGIRHTRLRHQCHLMLTSHEKHDLALCSSCMRQL